jgi:hypothetical protein
MTVSEELNAYVALIDAVANADVDAAGVAAKRKSEYEKALAKIESAKTDEIAIAESAEQAIDASLTRARTSLGTVGLERAVPKVVRPGAASADPIEAAHAYPARLDKAATSVEAAVAKYVAIQKQIADSDEAERERRRVQKLEEERRRRDAERARLAEAQKDAEAAAAAAAQRKQMIIAGAIGALLLIFILLALVLAG